MKSQMQGLASLGRFEDDSLAHVSTGEMIVPPASITPQTRRMIESDMMNMGMNPNQYVVGGDMSINPNTGLPEFFLKKLIKKIGKAVKKVAPIAVNFIPGIGPVAKAALTTVAGKASGMDTKDALLGGALSFAGSKLFGGTPTGSKTGRFSRLRNFFNPAEGTTGIRGGTLGPNIRRGIGNLFRGQQPMGDVTVVDGGPFGGKTYELNGKPISMTELQNMGFTFDADGNPLAPTQGATSDYDPVTGKGQSRIGKIEDFLKGFGGGQKGQSGIGQIEDFLRGTESDTVRKDDKFGLGNLGIASLAGLVGKLAYEEAKRNKGIPLTPLTTMDQLGRYNIAAEIARQKGEEMPSRVEFGLNPEGLPVLQGGGVGITPRNVATGGMIYSQADGDHNGIMQFAEGGVVKMQEGGDASVLNLDMLDEYINFLRQEEQKAFEESRVAPGTNPTGLPILGDRKRIQASQNYIQARKDVVNAIRNITDENLEAYARGDFKNLSTGIAKNEIEKYEKFVNTQKNKKIKEENKSGIASMQEGGNVPTDPSDFPPMDGDINGPGTETSDDIPAMLSDGEFVMTAKAVRGAGGFDMAKGNNGIVTLTPNGNPGRESGNRIMYKLMEHFGSMA